MKTDREKNGLMGAAHAVRVKVAEISKQNGGYAEKPFLLQTTSYDTKGNVTENANYNVDGSLQSRVISDYDGAGKLIATARYKADGSPGGRTILTYNEEGKAISRLSYTPDDLLNEKLIITYVASGGRVEELFLEGDKENSFETEAVVYEVEGVTYNAQSARLIKSVYETDSRLAEVLFYNAKPSLISKVVMTYDTDGNLISNTQYIGEAFLNGKTNEFAAILTVGDPLFGRIYIYDAGRKKIEENFYFVGSLNSKKIFTYDDRGNISEEIEYEADGSLRSRVSFAYEFDSMGNWVKQTVSRWIAESGDLEPTTVTYRTITYY